VDRAGGKNGGIVSPKGPAGSMILFHSCLVHASTSNLSPWNRVSVYLSLCAVSNHIRRFKRPEFIAHRDFTPIACLPDDCLLKPYPVDVPWKTACRPALLPRPAAVRPALIPRRPPDMSLYAKLQQRAAEGKPIRIGLIGAGKFGSMYLAQVPRTPGVHLVGIADLSPDNARANLARVGWEAAAHRGRIARRRAQDRRHARRHRLAGAGAPSRHRRHRRMHRPPDRRGRPLPGSLRARQARGQRHGGSRRLLRPAAGAQGGRGRRRLFAGLRRPAGADLRPGGLGPHLRLPVVAAGRGHKWLPHFSESTPETVWGNYGLTPEQAKRGGLNPKMFNSFLDGSKPSIESTAVANATGLGVPSNGLLYPPASVEDIPYVTRPRSEGGVLERKGMVEVISSLEADGRKIPYDIRMGVWVTVEAETEYIKNCFEEYNAHTDPSGRYFTLYKRWHLIGLEVGMSVASVALRGEPTGVATGWNADVVATAKRDLQPGELLDGEGGYTVWGKLLPADTSVRMGGLPLGLAHDVKVVRPVKKGQSLSWADVAMDTSTHAYRSASRWKTCSPSRS
jgi:predicted homoserine dehydrogenase-like protein